MKNTNCKKSRIGGQALIEGVMMRGLSKVSMAVRLPDGTIDLEDWPVSDLMRPSFPRKIPVLRGCISLVESLRLGFICLTKSAEKAEAYEQGEKEKEGADPAMTIAGVVGTVLGALICILLFLYLPALLVKTFVPIAGLRSLAEGFVKMVLFLFYLFLISRLKEIKRTFGYHGAEHKSIACYEAGEDLLVENVKTHSRFHPRCGTSFLFLILIVSILIFSFVTWQNLWVRVLLKIALLPLVVGLSYEIIRFAGKSDSVFSKIVSAPGLWLQRLTTNEPDYGQMETAIAALKNALPENPEEDRW